MHDNGNKFFEKGIYPISNIYCEPFLTKYNLYPTNSFKKNNKQTNKLLRDFIAYCDGKTNIFDICKKINVSLEEIETIVEICEKNKLIKLNYKKRYLKNIIFLKSINLFRIFITV